MSATTRWLTASCTALVALVAATVPASAAPAARSAPAQATATYIVTLDSETSGAEVAATASAQLDDHRPGTSPGRVFRSALRGYTARLTTTEASALATEPGVLAVERDFTVTAFDTQSNPPWGVDRVDQRALPLSSSYTYTQAGAGVRAYVIDTGIRFAHQDFAGRAVSGFDAVDGGTADDCNGHGTHVASTLGGETHGVAKDVTLVAVRVLDCNGTGAASGVIAGIDWAVGNHQPGQPAVANFSLGGGASTALDQAIARLVGDGVTVAAAAGNSAADACGTSPARVPAALTVAASTQADGLASFSNRGSCVDVIAPGAGVTAAWHTGNTATNTVNGTSMASPHAAGAAAKYLSAQPGATPAQVTGAITNEATTGAVSGTGESCWLWIFCTAATPNRLLYTSR